MSEPESANRDAVLELAASFEVRSVNLMMSAKRTIKVGDEYRSFESSVSWTLKHPNLDLVSPEVAKAVAHRFTPQLIRKVYTDLVIGGVMTLAEAKEAIEKAELSYKRLLEVKKREVVSGRVESQGDLRGAGGHEGGPPAEPAARV